MLALIPLLALVALILTVVSASGRCPLFVPVLLLCLIVLLQVWR